MILGRLVAADKVKMDINRLEGERPDLVPPTSGCGKQTVNRLDDFTTVYLYKKIAGGKVDWEMLSREADELPLDSPQIPRIKRGLIGICSTAEEIAFASHPPDPVVLADMDKCIALFCKLNQKKFLSYDFCFAQGMRDKIDQEMIFARIQNKTTLFEVDIRDVCRLDLFVSESGHGFDVNDIIAMMDNQDQLYNPYTKQEFTKADLEKLKKFGAMNRHPVFQRIVNPEATRIYEMEIRALVEDISLETEREIERLEVVLRQKHGIGEATPEESARVLEEKGTAVMFFKEYFDRLSSKEQKALMKLSKKNSFLRGTGIDKEIQNLLEGGCSAGTNQYFQEVLDLLHRGR